jgi:hypothetical protein
MKLIYALLTLFVALITTSAQAVIFYRHIPFYLELHPYDQLVVDYDFSEKKSIYCNAPHATFKISFNYKGHQKFAYLPVILQSDHIPDHQDEELADLKGQFKLYAEPTRLHAYTVVCHYDADTKTH